MNDKGTNTALEELEMELCLEAVRRYYGYDFRDYERAGVRRGVRECMMAARISSISRFQEKILRDPALLERFLCTFSTPAVSMFSDPAFYRAFSSKVVPLLRTYPFIRIWQAGCSTGQGIYSLAILLEEEGIYQRCRLYATDLSEEAVRQARRGSFPISANEAYASNYVAAGGKRSFSDYSRKKGNRLLIDPSLKSNIVFSEHNLATDGSFNEFHVIVCRDILSSFNQVLRERVSNLLYDSLGPLGVLALGARESPKSLAHGAAYSPLDEASGLFRKLGYQGEALVSSLTERNKSAEEVRRDVL